ncbi:c-type cytochrome [Devosia sp. A16]|uniref:c-type cytochrome n=1 Tax=Devosia sp. A16 TaxID=1736675 RepID=UPI0009E9FAF2|nr:cytochrome c [Devosia sp. A16]
MPSRVASSPLGRLVATLCLLPAMACCLGLPAANAQNAPAPAAAPADAAVERGLLVWKSQDCIGCHGWAGNGERIGENPRGPNLRALELDAETLKEVVMCGRPGTQMPYHDPAAYSDDRCYGMTRTDTQGMQLLEGKPITAEEADDLVAYMEARMLGRPEQPNQDDCRAYYGKRPFCDKLPTAAEQGL